MSYGVLVCPIGSWYVLWGPGVYCGVLACPIGSWCVLGVLVLHMCLDIEVTSQVHLSLQLTVSRFLKPHGNARLACQQPQTHRAYLIHNLCACVCVRDYLQALNGVLQLEILADLLINSISLLQYLPATEEDHSRLSYSASVHNVEILYRLVCVQVKCLCV